VRNAPVPPARNEIFQQLSLGGSYSRPSLAKLWGYRSYHALARGVVTPKGSNTIILFVTEQKQASQAPYEDLLKEGKLFWDGPKSHGPDERIVRAAENGDEIHLFHRRRHHADFEYLGKLHLIDHVRRTRNPSSFVFRVLTVIAPTQSSSTVICG
jgi:hypothetical protein